MARFPDAPRGGSPLVISLMVLFVGWVAIVFGSGVVQAVYSPLLAAAERSGRSAAPAAPVASVSTNALADPFAPPVPPLPDWIPVPPAAKLIAHAPNQEGGGTFLLAIPLPWAEAGRFYEKRLGGHALSRNDVVGAATAGVVITATLGGADEPQRTFQVTITQDGRKSQAAGTYGNGPYPGL